MAGKKLIVLYSGYGSANKVGQSQQERAITFLKVHDMPFEMLDAADPDKKEARNDLFEISGIRGNYPQFFVQDEDGKKTYLGDWEKIDAINDSSSLPADVLEKNPDILTWDRVLA